ncbi:GNAT family N-acetyltransferase [bacterium]|nr:GNAT family N-acetyltransferase [bacterium]
MIETKRLRIYPANREQMETLKDSATDTDLQSAYGEMLEYALQNPKQWEWYAAWLIELKDGTHIGDLCFKGLKDDGTAEIGYGIMEEYQGQGYATEAVEAALDWAFQNPLATAIEAETEPDNLASQRVLAKCGFATTGTRGEEGPRFRLLKQSYTPANTRL